MPYFLDGTIAGLPEPRKPGRPGFFQRTFRRGQPSFCTPSVHLFGWLDHRMPYSFGPIGPEALSVLEKAVVAGHVWGMRGFHHCRMCPTSSPGPTRCNAATRKYHLGSASLIVTDVDGNPWVAPNFVLHYVTVHGYAPPIRVYDAPPGLIASIRSKGCPDIVMQNLI